MLEEYPALVFGLVLGLFVAFWAWQGDEQDTLQGANPQSSNGSFIRYLIATIGTLGFLGGLIAFL